MSSSVPEEQQKKLPVEQTGPSQPEKDSPTNSTPSVSDAYLIHPETLYTLQSRPGQISYLTEASRYAVTLAEEVNSEGVVTNTGIPWIHESPDPSMQGPLRMHIECTFLSHNALRVRMGLEASFAFPDPFPMDSTFPPPALRPRLFSQGLTSEPVAGDKRDDLVCGLQLHANDGSIWVNPRDSGLELTWATPPFGLHATWQEQSPLAGDDGVNKGNDYPDKPEGNEGTSLYHRFYTLTNKPKPLFEQAPLGPFTPALLPNGIMKVGDDLVGTELLILGAGEKLQSGGPGRHRKETDTKPLATTETTPVPMEAREGFSTHFGGRYPEEKTAAAAPPFLWTDRGVGLLMKDPIGVRMADLQDGRAMLGLRMHAGDEGKIDYIIVVGDALEACKAEYPVE